MARYHFEVRTDSHVANTAVAELDGREAARIEAAKRVGTLLHDHAQQLWVDEDWRMDVTDDTGLILFTVQVSVIDPTTSMAAKRPDGPADAVTS